MYPPCQLSVDDAFGTERFELFLGEAEGLKDLFVVLAQIRSGLVIDAGGFLHLEGVTNDGQLLASGCLTGAGTLTSISRTSTMFLSLAACSQL